MAAKGTVCSNRGCDPRRASVDHVARTRGRSQGATTGRRGSHLGGCASAASLRKQRARRSSGCTTHTLTHAPQDWSHAVKREQPGGVAQLRCRQRQGPVSAVQGVELAQGKGDATLGERQEVVATGDSLRRVRRRCGSGLGLHLPAPRAPGRAAGPAQQHAGVHGRLHVLVGEVNSTGEANCVIQCQRGHDCLCLAASITSCAGCYASAAVAAAAARRLRLCASRPSHRLHPAMLPPRRHRWRLCAPPRCRWSACPSARRRWKPARPQTAGCPGSRHPRRPRHRAAGRTPGTSPLYAARVETCESERECVRSVRH